LITTVLIENHQQSNGRVEVIQVDAARANAEKQLAVLPPGDKCVAQVWSETTIVIRKVK
jgi:hypothetical protein